MCSGLTCLLYISAVPLDWRACLPGTLSDPPALLVYNDRVSRAGRAGSLTNVVHGTGTLYGTARIEFQIIRVWYEYGLLVLRYRQTLNRRIIYNQSYRMPYDLL